MTLQAAKSKLKRRRRALRIFFAGSLPLIIMAGFVLHALRLERAETSATPSGFAPSKELISFSEAQLNFGRGYIGDGWRLYFNEPDASADRASYAGGIKVALVDAIEATEGSLDIAAFELNSEAIYRAILDAHERGVAVRIVTDDEHGLQDKNDPALRNLRDEGIAVVDDGRSGLMHNKFMIMDGQRVWTGSWNYTVNGTYRNNNNVFVMDHEMAASAYQAEFDEMFQRSEFGTRSTDDGIVSFANGEGDVSIIFAAEADELAALKAEIAGAESTIRIMTFVFSLQELAEAILEQAANPGITVQAVFEDRNSTASWSQLPALHCAGAATRQDGNRYLLHHKVIIIDEHTVITGSFNFSKSAAAKNDENIVIIRDATIAGLYLDEWQRVWDSANELAANEVVCD